MNEVDQKALNKALSRAAVDREFREQLVADPAQTLRDNGVEVPDGFNVELVEVSESRMVLLVPPFSGDRMSSAALDEVAAGKMYMTDFIKSGSFGLFSSTSNELWSFPPPQNQNVSRQKEQ